MTHCYLYMYLKVSATGVFATGELDPAHFLSATGLAWPAWYWYAINGIERN